MIPIYRAKKIDSDEYVIGFLYQDIIEYIKSDGLNPDEYKKALDKESWYIMDNLSHTNMIDKSTLAIHFPDMLDSQGNKIFASLSEDGRGGDIMKDDEYYGIAKYKDSRFIVEYENVEECLFEGNFEVIGIQE